jgi:hypothetical protein
VLAGGVGVVNALLGPEAIAAGDPRTGHQMARTAPPTASSLSRGVGLGLAGLVGGSVRCLRTAQWTRASIDVRDDRPPLWGGLFLDSA